MSLNSCIWVIEENWEINNEFHKRWLSGSPCLPLICIKFHMQTANSYENATEESLAPECVTQLCWSGQARRLHTGPYSSSWKYIDIYSWWVEYKTPLHGCKNLCFLLTWIYKNIYWTANELQTPSGYKSLIFPFLI